MKKHPVDRIVDAVVIGRGTTNVDTTPLCEKPSDSAIHPAMVKVANLMEAVRQGYFDEICTLDADDRAVGCTLSLLNYRLIKEGFSPSVAMWSIHTLISRGMLFLAPGRTGKLEDLIPQVRQLPKLAQDHLYAEHARKSAWPPVRSLSTDEPAADWFDVVAWTAAEMWEWIEQGHPQHPAPEEALSRSSADADDEPGYLGLIVDKYRRGIQRAECIPVELNDSATLWGMFLAAFDMAGAPIPPAKRRELQGDNEPSALRKAKERLNERLLPLGVAVSREWELVENDREQA